MRVASLEDRVTTVEAHADHHTRAIEALRTDVLGVRSEMAQMRHEMSHMRGEMSQMRGEMATRSDVGQLVQRLDFVDAKVDRLFMWTVGLMVSGFFVVIGALVGVAFRLG